MRPFKMTGRSGRVYLPKFIKKPPKGLVGRAQDRYWNTTLGKIDGDPVQFHREEEFGTVLYFTLEESWWAIPYLTVEGIDRFGADQETDLEFTSDRSTGVKA